MQIIDCEQGSPEWYAARVGVITASRFHDVLAGGAGLVRMKYMRQLAGEIVRGIKMDSFTNKYTERGNEYEPEALELYSLETGNKPEICGFMVENGIGFSPDFLVEDGTGEIKTRSADLQIELIYKDTVPPEHRAQIQGGLMVSDRKFCDFVSHCPGLPLFRKRVFRDEQYILTLRMAIATFQKELASMVQFIESKF